MIFYIAQESEPVEIDFIFYILSYIKKDAQQYDFNLIDNNSLIMICIDSLSSFKQFHNIIIELRNGNKNPKILVTGLFLNYIDIYDFKLHYPEINYVVVGKGEEVIKSIIENNIVDGIYYDYDFPNIKQYNFDLKYYTEGQRIQIQTQWGSCPYGKCIFCMHNKENKFLPQTYKFIIKQIKYYYNNGIRKFCLNDPCVPVKKLAILLKELKKENMTDIYLYIVGMRPSYDYQPLNGLINKFDKIIVNIGVEFYNQDLLNLYNRGTTIKQIDDCLKILIDNNVEVNVGILFGIPKMELYDINFESYKKFKRKYSSYVYESISFFLLIEDAHIFNKLKDFGIELDNNIYLDEYDNNLEHVKTKLYHFHTWNDLIKKMENRMEVFNRESEFAKIEKSLCYGFNPL